MSPTAKTSTSGATARGRMNDCRSTHAAIRLLVSAGASIAWRRAAALETPAMFLTFFANLRQAHVPVTPREYLDLMRALEGDLAEKSVDEFYRLSRALLVKDERNLDTVEI